MTDEELAVAMMAAYDFAKTSSWVDGADDLPSSRYRPRVLERWIATVRDVRHRVESSQRESTAATVLAALLRHDALSGVMALQREWHPEKGLVSVAIGAGDTERAMYAVALADALRAALAKKGTL